jgi:hypothetical protein
MNLLKSFRVISHVNVESKNPTFQRSVSISIIRVRVTLRLVVYRQSVRLSDKPLETHDQ